jgi:hypothetical protein
MKMAEIRKKAQNLGLNSGKMKKADLIRSIQTKEGNDPCYKVKNGSCDQYECCWRDDCKPK